MKSTDVYEPVRCDIYVKIVGSINTNVAGVVLQTLPRKVCNIANLPPPPPSPGKICNIADLPIAI